MLYADKGSRLDKKLSPYLKATPTQKVLVTQCAAENGVASAFSIRFSCKFPERKHNLWGEKQVSKPVKIKKATR